ncbi:MAG: bifunctional glycosyltransferase/class I SAM-dependent methyltransferase [Acidimicrobiia bacterium]|nr:bifunctional glycosyltransferase/class I SAM-dependent methyltransferase [Acidimicrobiia bacterium]
MLLHGDGQYAPELLPDMVAPLERDECDAVLGSRMIDPGAARRGGMPHYKYLGNRVLTAFENRVMGTELSEWHSGYRAYSVDALRAIPFERNSDGFDFDTQVIVQLIEAGRRIREVPIPTYYGDEISHVNGLRYAWDVSAHVVRYRLQRMGFGSGDLVFARRTYEDKAAEDSSHGVVVDWLRERSPRRVLDVGCDDGSLAARFRAAGHEVTGVDAEEHPETKVRLDRFVRADLDGGLPAAVGEDYDIVVAADVLEHLRNPEALLRRFHDVLRPNGSVVVSVPNVGHWYPRLRFASGHFDYDRRGILDRGHLRFFTRRSFTRLARRCGYRVVRLEPTGLPLEISGRGGADQAGSGSLARWAGRLDRVGLTVWPDLFAYQWVFELQPR